MNIISAILFFVVAFSIGVQFTEPEIGTVAAGSSAWKAGLMPGDKIVSVNDEDVIEFMEIMVSVALGSKSEPIRMTVERPSVDGQETQRLPITVSPQWNQELGFNRIGIRPGLSNELGKVAPESPAGRAGLSQGDLIVGAKVGGLDLGMLPPIQLLDAVELHSYHSPDDPIELKVLRDDGEHWVKLIPEKQAGSELKRQIGIGSAQGNVIRGLRRNSEAAKILKEGDQVLEVAGEPFATISWLKILQLVQESKEGNGGKLAFKVRSLGPGTEATTREITTDAAAFLKWYVQGDIQWGGLLTTVEAIRPENPIADAGLKVGDTLIALNGIPCYSAKDIETILEKETGDTLSLVIERDGGRETLNVPRTTLNEVSDIQWGRLPLLGAIIRGGPADQAGIETGSVILSIARKRVHTWKQLTESISPTRRLWGFLWRVPATKPGSPVEIAWRTPSGEEKSATVAVGLAPRTPLLPLKPNQKITRAGIVEACALGARRTIVVSEWVFLTLRSLFQGEVSPKNLQGPVGITHVLTRVSEQGLGTLIYFLAIISVNLGLFNLLPFPILDGGHLLFLAIEKVKGSPVDIRIQEWSMNIAFLLIISLAVFVTFNDLTRLFN